LLKNDQEIIVGEEMNKTFYLILMATLMFSCSVNTKSKFQSDSDIINQDKVEDDVGNERIDDVVDNTVTDDSVSTQKDDIVVIIDDDSLEPTDDGVDGPDEGLNDEDRQPDEVQVEVDEVSNDNEDETPDEDIDLLEPFTDYTAMLIGTSADEYGVAFGKDGDGNIYLTGYTEGNLDDQINAGGQDIFLIKFDDKGNKLWTRLYGSENDDVGRSVQIDSAGNIYLTGYTSGDMGGDGNLGKFDVYLMKLDKDGGVTWVKQFGTENTDMGMKLVFDNLENLYVSGNINGREEGDFLLGTHEAFVAKFDKNGSRIWIEQWGSVGYNNSYYTKYHNGYLYVPGSTTEGLGSNSYAGGNYDSFLAKVSVSGNTSWLRQWGSAGSEIVYDFDWDSQSNIYLCGMSTEGVDSEDMNDYGMSFTKLDSSGDLQFEKVWKSIGWSAANAIISDGDNSFYLSGSSYGNFNGYKNAGQTDFFLTKVDKFGNLIWTKLVGSGGIELAYPSIMDNYGNIYISGATTGDLGGIKNSGGTDIFIVKFSSEDL